MAVVNNTFLAPDFGLAQGFDAFDYRGADNQDIRSAKESTDVALDWWSKTEGAKFLFWHVMEPHMDLLPPEETRGVFVQDPSVDVPFGFSPQPRSVGKMNTKLRMFCLCMMRRYSQSISN